MKTQKELFDLLERIGIKFVTYHHEPLYTVEQSKEACSFIPGHHVKNLFLKDNKNKLWLVVMDETKRIELKTLAKMLGVSRLSFANKDLLMQYLGVEPGAVTPLGLINDVEKMVSVVLDRDMLTETQINFHPLKNNATIGISAKDFEKFLSHCGNLVVVTDLTKENVL